MQMSENSIRGVVILEMEIVGDSVELTEGMELLLGFVLVRKRSVGIVQRGLRSRADSDGEFRLTIIRFQIPPHF